MYCEEKTLITKKIATKIISLIIDQEEICKSLFGVALGFQTSSARNVFPSYRMTFAGPLWVFYRKGNSVSDNIWTYCQHFQPIEMWQEMFFSLKCGWRRQFLFVDFETQIIKITKNSSLKIWPSIVQSILMNIQSPALARIC